VDIMLMRFFMWVAYLALTIQLLGLLAVYVVLLACWVWKGRYREALVSVGLASLAVGAAFWAMFQSRSSTAGLGALAVPTLAGMSGLSTLAMFSLGRSARPVLQRVRWLFALGALAPTILTLSGGVQTARRYRALDDETRLRAVYREQIRQLLLANPGRESEILHQEIDKRRNDHVFVAMAIASDHVDAELLTTLGSDSGGFAREVACDRNTPWSVVEHLYRTTARPEDVVRCVAGRDEAPAALLSELDVHPPRTPGGVRDLLARNPHTPRDILLKLSDEIGIGIADGLLENPAATCDMVKKAEARELRFFVDHPMSKTEGERAYYQSRVNKFEAAKRRVCAGAS
jgi:hypothetical protein